MDSPDDYTAAEVLRLRQWKQHLVDDLGDELRRCIGYLHSGPDGLTCLRRLLKRINADPLLRQGALIYYDRLTAMLGPSNGDYCGR